MFGIGMPEMLVILAIALVVIGPDRIPEVARTLGKLYAELTRSLRDMRASTGVDDLREGVETIRNPVAAAGKRMGKAILEDTDPAAKENPLPPAAEG